MVLGRTRELRGGGAQAWVRAGASAGFVASMLIPAAVALVWVRPDLTFGYALVLLPLLLAGPLATRSLAGARALAAALLAGLTSGSLAAISLAVGSQLLGGSDWALVNPASMPPLPEVPHLSVLPSELMTWAQQDVLVFQPLLALAFGAISIGLRHLAIGRLLPDSLGARLRLALGGLTALTLLVGWAGFSALEEMHVREHQLQLIARWQTALDEAAAALSAEELGGADTERGRAAADQFEEIFEDLEHTDSYPGIALGPSTVRAAYARYDETVDAVRDAHAEYRAHPEDPVTYQQTRAALGMLRTTIDSDTLALLDSDDLAHHQRLFVVLIAVGVAGALGLWLGERTRATVLEPVTELGAHVEQVARGQFDGRVRGRGPAEMRDLATAVNHMTAELERLSAVERQSFQEQLWHQAFHDPLTGLPNRALFRDRLEQALARADRQLQSLAILVLDLDNFKLVNDSLGHEQGDALLLSVAERLRTCLRGGDTAARLGGDEFTLLLEEVAGLDGAIHVAERLAEVLRAPLVLGGHDIVPTVSIGIALSAPRHSRPESLLRDAELAMYRAKADGKDRFAVFDRAMHAHAAERLSIEGDLRRALDRGELRVQYQPIVALPDGEIVEFEALVRWHHPERGSVAPAEFIPVAEETGLIVPIGQLVLEQACRQAKDWHQRWPMEPPLVMSVNLSARQFQHPGLVDDIRDALEAAGLDAAYLKLELTESMVMQDVQAATQTLRRLKALGIQLAIDDFGTGYSSLGYLKRFPIDTLKVDRSFVDGLEQDPRNRAIVRSVLALARNLGLTVTAEGVETVAQLRILEKLQCDRGQGYLFARPQTAAEVDELLRRRTSWRRAA